MPMTPENKKDNISVELLKDRVLAGYVLEIMQKSQEASLLKENRAANLIKRFLLLSVVRKIITAPLQYKVITHSCSGTFDLLIEQQTCEIKALESEAAEKIQQLKSSNDIGLLPTLDASVNLLEQECDDKKRELVDHHQQRLDELAANKHQQISSIPCHQMSKEVKSEKTALFSERAASLGQVIQQQSQQLVKLLKMLKNTEECLTEHTRGEIHTSSFFQPKHVNSSEFVRRKAIGVKAKVTLGQSCQILEAVGKGDIDTVEKLLNQNIALLYTQGTVKDVAERTFKEITVFQYALWASDIPMCEMLLKYFKKYNSKQDAAHQMQSLNQDRVDISSKCGTYFSLQHTMNQYDSYAQSNRENETLENPLLWKAIGVAQLEWPAWLRHKFVEPEKPSWFYGSAGAGKNNKSSWQLQDVNKSYVRYQDNANFLKWSEKIKEALSYRSRHYREPEFPSAWLRSKWENAWFTVSGDGVWGLFTFYDHTGHDRDNIKMELNKIEVFRKNLQSDLNQGDIATTEQREASVSLSA